MLRLAFKRQSSIACRQIKYFSKLSCSYHSELNNDSINLTSHSNPNLNPNPTPLNPEFFEDQNTTKNSPPIDLKLSYLLENVNKNALFTVIDPMIPSSDSVNIYKLSDEDRLPFKKPKRTRLPMVPKSVDNNSFSKFVYETTQFSYSTKELTDINHSYVEILYNFAMNNVEGSDLKIEFKSILDLISYFADKEEYKKIYPLMRKYIGDDKEKEIEAYHILFNHLETSTRGFDILFQRLNTMNHKSLKLDSYLIYKIYMSLKTYEKEEFINILKSKNIPIKKIFGNSVELDQMKSIDQFKEFAENNCINGNSFESTTLKLRFLLNNNKNDEVIELMREKNILVLPDELVPIFIESFLKENRLSELWFYLKSDTSKLTEAHIKKILDYLYVSKQSYFILPFISILTKYRIGTLNKYAWSLIFRYAQDSFDKHNETYWLLMRGLVALCHLNLERKDKLLFIHDMRDFLKHKKRIFYYNPYVKPETKEQWTLRFNLRFLYLWNTYNPIFNLNLNKREFRFIARLFNPEIESSTVKTLKELLKTPNNLPEATEKLETLISSNEINQYHLLVFIDYYCKQYDLIGLTSFITYIEANSSMKIKFLALSQFTPNFLNNLNTILRNKVGNERNMMKKMVIYLYQQTYIDSSIWTRRNNRINKLGLDFDSLSNHPNISLIEVQEILRKLVK